MSFVYERKYLSPFKYFSLIKRALVKPRISFLFFRPPNLRRSGSPGRRGHVASCSLLMITFVSSRRRLGSWKQEKKSNRRMFNPFPFLFSDCFFLRFARKTKPSAFLIYLKIIVNFLRTSRISKVVSREAHRIKWKLRWHLNTLKIRFVLIALRYFVYRQR